MTESFTVTGVDGKMGGQRSGEAAGKMGGQRSGEADGKMGGDEDGKMGGQRSEETNEQRSGRRDEQLVATKKKIYQKSTLTKCTQQILSSYSYHVITFDKKKGRHQRTSMRSNWSGLCGKVVLSNPNSLSIKMTCDGFQWKIEN